MSWRHETQENIPTGKEKSGIYSAPEVLFWEVKISRKFGNIVPGVFTPILAKHTKSFNLLLNAAEAMPSGGRLRISLRESFDWIYRRRKEDRKGVRLTIADTGCGIPTGDREHIFEPFFTTKAEKGTGLGLWVLQGIIAKHEGVMSLRSSATVNQSGTVISIFLPSHARGPRTSVTSRAESAA